LLFFSIPRPPRSPLFPYTTLFRSCCSCSAAPRIKRAGTSSIPISISRDLDMGCLSFLFEHRKPETFPLFQVGLCDLPGKITYPQDRKSTRLNSSHVKISYAVFCLK